MDGHDTVNILRRQFFKIHVYFRGTPSFVVRTPLTDSDKLFVVTLLWRGIFNSTDISL
jgi:hypothetical protein